jgi:Domain of unknown function (DUF4258)
MAEPLEGFVITEHAAFELQRRGIARETVHRVLTAPEQRHEVRPGRDVFQVRISLAEPPKTYLVRVFVDIDREPAEVVTAYRTSKIDKYWRPE